MQSFGIGYVLVAYGLIWLLFFGYILLLGRRIVRLQKDISTLSK